MGKSKLLLKILTAMLTAVLFFTAAGCSAMPDGGYPKPGDAEYNLEDDGNVFRKFTENPFVYVSDAPASQFAMDVNTSSYSIMRRAVNGGYTVPKESVRIEEWLNYFKYDIYPAPESGEALSVTPFLTACPWNAAAKLLTVGVRAADLQPGSRANNLVFLIDVSASMDYADRLPLIKTAFLLMLDGLTAEDRVSVITYAGANRVVLNGAAGNETLRIRSAIEDFAVSSGGTNASGGITTAYDVARQNFIEDGNNRIILATDGDFNLGATTVEGVKQLILNEKEKGEELEKPVSLTALGLGYGNLNDENLEALAIAGDGSCHYIDSLTEARRLLVNTAYGTPDTPEIFNTVAKDVKAQVEFNPKYVEKYRLLGYENKQLTESEWNDPKTNAGEVGSGLCVTALYEVVLKSGTSADTLDGAAAKVTVKYKEYGAAAGSQDLEISAGILPESLTALTGDLAFISAVAECALVMRDSKFMGIASLQSAITRLQALNLTDDYKAEFLELMIKYWDNLYNY